MSNGSGLKRFNKKPGASSNSKSNSDPSASQQLETNNQEPTIANNDTDAQLLQAQPDSDNAYAHQSMGMSDHDCNMMFDTSTPSKDTFNFDDNYNYDDYEELETEGHENPPQVDADNSFTLDDSHGEIDNSEDRGRGGDQIRNSDKNGNGNSNGILNRLAERRRKERELETSSAPVPVLAPADSPPNACIPESQPTSDERAGNERKNARNNDDEHSQTKLDSSVETSLDSDPDLNSSVENEKKEASTCTLLPDGLIGDVNAVVVEESVIQMDSNDGVNTDTATDTDPSIQMDPHEAPNQFLREMSPPIQRHATVSITASVPVLPITVASKSATVAAINEEANSPPATESGLVSSTSNETRVTTMHRSDNTPGQGTINPSINNEMIHTPAINTTDTAAPVTKQTGSIVQRSVAVSASGKSTVAPSAALPAISTRTGIDSTLPTSVNHRVAIATSHERNSSVSLSASNRKFVPSIRMTKRDDNTVAPKIMTNQTGFPPSNNTLVPRQGGSSSVMDMKSANGGPHVPSRKVSSLPNKRGPDTGIKKIANGVRTVRGHGQAHGQTNPKQSHAIGSVPAKTMTSPYRNVQTVNGGNRVLPAHGTRVAVNRVSTAVMTAPCAGAHNAMMNPVTPSPPPPMGRSRGSTYQREMDSVQKENQPTSASSFLNGQVHAVQRENSNVGNTKPLMSSNRVVPPAASNNKGRKVAQPSDRGKNFDDLLTSFTINLVDSVDIWDRSDADMVDLNVKLCVSQNVALRLHGSFDDLLEDVDNILRDC